MYFITGVSGVGKTSIIQHLQSLRGKSFEVYDFDERGVPDSADHKWRIEETKYWMKFAQQKEAIGKVVIVCGFFNPEEISEIKKEIFDVEVKIILLDADDEIIEERLRERNADPGRMKDFERAIGDAEKFIKNNTAFASVLRNVCKRFSCQRIDTTNISPEEVAHSVIEIIKT